MSLLVMLVTPKVSCTLQSVGFRVGPRVAMHARCVFLLAEYLGRLNKDVGPLEGVVRHVRFRTFPAVLVPQLRL